MTTMQTRIAGLVLALGLGAGSAFAQMYTALLSGLSEVPPNASPAAGTVTAVLTGNSLALSGSFAGLIGNFTASHIHNAPAGANGGVVFPLLVTPAGPTAGSYNPASNTFSLTAAQVALLQAGSLYVNVHSTQWPGGEIRGQLLRDVTTGADNQPAAFALEQNYPNPFNPTTTIRFTLDETGPASVVVHNVMGQSVATLVNGMLERGEHALSFDAGALPSGRYTYTLHASGRSETRGMLLLR